MTKILEESYLKASTLPEEEQDKVGQAVLALIAGVTGVQATDGQGPRRKRRAKAGSAKGLILYMADDFDAPLEDFKDYM